MSLVSEALKKAQREATARQGREQGLTEPPSLQPFRARRRRRRGLQLGIAFGLVALLALAGAYLVRRLPRGPAEEVRPAPARQAAAPEAPAPADASRPTVEGAARQLPQDASPSPARVSASTRPLHPPPPADAPQAAALASSPSGSEPQQPVERAMPAATVPPAAGTTGEAATALEPSRQGLPAAAAPARPAPARDFVRRAELPDGTVLELGGIAYSASAPFAYLNGKLLAVGETVAGFRIESIARDRVVLASGGQRITLRLKTP